MANETRARKNGLKALDSVQKTLTKVGWEPQISETEGVFIVDFSVDNIPVSDAVADLRIDYERFVFYLNIKGHASAKTQIETIEFVTRANYDLIIGNFEFNFKDDSVRFKSSIDFTEETLSEALIRNVIKCAMDVVEQYGDELVHVMKGVKKAAQAISDAESA